MLRTIRQPSTGLGRPARTGGVSTMGLRFRRTLKIMPGVRLNFSRSGVSASLGPRGSTVTVGGRYGTAVNLGIPGTGLSFRQTVGQGRTGGVTKAQPARWERRQQREAERQQALAALQADEHELESLTTSLARRDTVPMDWASEFAASPPLLSSVYKPPVPLPTGESAISDVRAEHPATHWAGPAGAAAVGAALAPQPLLRLALLVIGVGLVLHWLTVRKRFPEAAYHLYRARRGEFAALDKKARQEFEAEEAERRAEFEASEALKAKFRSLVADENLALAASLLEVELSNEDLGVPITFDIGFEDLRRVRLLIALPRYEVIPATRSRLTKTGKLSRRTMAQRDRKELYESVCAGVVLRLMYETFRVLPFVDHVQTIGTAATPGLGSVIRRYAGLAIETTRVELLRMDLDGGHPAAILRALGGQLTLARDGTLKPIEGLADDLE